MKGKTPLEQIIWETEYTLLNQESDLSVLKTLLLKSTDRKVIEDINKRLNGSDGQPGLAGSVKLLIQKLNYLKGMKSNGNRETKTGS